MFYRNLPPLILASSLATAALFAQPNRPALPEGMPPRPSMEELLQRFDANGNGFLEQEERDTARATMREERLTQMFDADGNGVLEGAEREEADAFVEQRRQQRMTRFDANGDGVVSPEERPARRGGLDPQRLAMMRAALLAAYDANGDGRLDEAERAAIREVIQARGIQPTQGRPGPRGSRAGKPGGAGPAGMRGGLGTDPAMIEKYDADGDGRLSTEELEAAREAFRNPSGQ